jgi:hypothetical protein
MLGEASDMTQTFSTGAPCRWCSCGEDDSAWPLIMQKLQRHWEQVSFRDASPGLPTQSKNYIMLYTISYNCIMYEFANSR